MKLTRKEVNSNTTAKMKELGKKYGYKKRDYALYKVQAEYFASVTICSWLLPKNKVRVMLTAEIKPFFFDDLFWEIFQMSDNSKEPISLRAVGAFSFRSLVIHSEERLFEGYDGADEYMENAMKRCDDKITEVVGTLNGDYRKFLGYARTLEHKVVFEQVLAEIFLDIREEKYADAAEKAKLEIQKGNTGGFVDSNRKGIYDYVLCYCNGKMKEV